MRTHTIPQNVTSYEDKLVGMLIGRQFVYLAIGGVVIFVLLTSKLLPVPLAVFISIIVGAWSAAMALLKINDRGFDVLFMSYMRAVLGPTEWSWQQDELPMRVLVQPDAPAPVQTTVVEPDPTAIAANNRQRVSQFEQYLDKQRSDLDDDEQAFLSKLNYSESIPQSTFAAAKSAKAAPPMLTPNHPQPPASAPTVAVQPFVPVAPKPLSPLASASGGPQMLVSLGNQERAVALMSNQRANRSLSRQLLSGGTLPLPVRGELSLAMPSTLKQELTSLIGFAPAGAPVTLTAPGPALASVTPVRDTGSAPEKPVATMPAPTPPAAELPPTAPLHRASTTDAAPVTPDPTHEPAGVDHSAMPSAAPQDEPKVTIDPPKASDEELEVAAEHVETQMAELQTSDPLLESSRLAEPVESEEAKVASPIPFKLHDSGLPADPVKQVRPILNTVFDTLPPAGADSVAPLPVSALDAPAAPAAVVVPAVPPSDKTVPLTSHPNVVNGVVLDGTGQFLAGVVVVVKDPSGEPKRALKTNKLGQFVILTPLPNGTYTVEVDKKGLTFDIMQIELTGAVPPPIEIKAKSS